MLALGAYVRISDDDRDEDGNLTRAGVTRQLSDCKALAAEMGARVVKTFDDNNITAADERVTRPGFEELLTDLENGVIDGFLFYHADRVARLEYDAARVTRSYRINPKLIGKSVTGGTDLSTDEGRAMFVVQCVMGGMEVSATRRRVTRRNREAAAQGRRHGGKRPFGWNEDGKTLREDEAKLIRKAIDDIPLGKGIATITKEWATAGVGPTAEGKGPLRYKTVKDRLSNPRICGYRIYIPAAERQENPNPWLPDHILYTDGSPVIGDWEPIVTPEKWRAAVAELEARHVKRPGQTFSRRSAKYLLSGIARCGECGAPLYGKVTNGAIRYLCRKNEGGCGGIVRVGAPVDEYVESVFLEAVKQDVGTAHKSVDDTIHDARIVEIQAEIKDVMSRQKPGHPKRISASVAMDLISELEEELAELTYAARALTADKVRRQADTPEILRDWNSYTIDMKRARLRRDIKAVIINRAPRGSRFNPAYLEIVWTE